MKKTITYFILLLIATGVFVALLVLSHSYDAVKYALAGVLTALVIVILWYLAKTIAEE
jgi:lysozyme family protein